VGLGLALRIISSPVLRETTAWTEEVDIGRPLKENQRKTGFRRLRTLTRQVGKSGTRQGQAAARDFA